MSFHSRTPVKAHQPVHDSTLTKATNWGQLVRLAGTRDTNHNGVCQTPAVMAQNLIGGYGHTQQAQLAHKRARPAVSSPRVQQHPPGETPTKTTRRPLRVNLPRSFCVTIYPLSFPNVPPALRALSFHHPRAFPRLPSFSVLLIASSPWSHQLIRSADLLEVPPRLWLGPRPHGRARRVLYPRRPVPNHFPEKRARRPRTDPTSSSNN